MADSDALAYLRNFVSASEGIPLSIPEFGDDDELDIDDELDEGDDDSGQVDDDELDEGDDEGVPGDGGGSGEDVAPGTPLSSKVERAIGAVIPAHVVERVARAPTPGGLFSVIAGLILLTVILVPANTSGATRLELVWRALTGGVTLPSTPRAQAVPVSSEVAQAEQYAAAIATDFWNATVGG